MSLPDLVDLAQLAISRPQDSVSTDGLWTSRSPILLPPSPTPGQHGTPFPTDPPSTAFPRSQFGLCANENGDVYFHGGFRKNPGLEDVLYHYSVTDNAITPIQCWGESPGDRRDHAMALVGGVIAVHGGAYEDDPSLYLLNLVSRKWSKVATSGVAPGNLHCHAMAVIDMTIYIFGGFTCEDDVYINFNAMWAFNLNALRTEEPVWELIEPTSHTQPTVQCQSTLVPFHNQLILYGGWGEDGSLGDVWSFDLKSRTWNELLCTGDIPPQQFGHTATILDDVMYVIGGNDSENALLKGVFALKIPERRWFKLRDTDNAPVPRSGHATTCIGTKIFTFTGYLGQSVSEDHPIHILDTKYIGNCSPHTPERLKELDIKFELMLIRTKLERRVEELEHENKEFMRSRIVSYLLESPSKMDSLVHLQRVDAQMVADFLADELERHDALQSNADRRRILHFLSKLAKSAQVFPKSTELSDVQCNLTSPVNDEGGYGFIYKGIFREQTVCVKAIRVVEYGIRQDRMLRAQAGEVVLLAHVSHPNVIPLYGAYLSSDEIPRICVVSPWMENGDLAAYLRKFPNTPKVPLMCDVAAGLDFMHDMGIIHADLKARNVLVSRSRRAMLADLGVATVLHTNVGATTAADFAGTAYWMAPELLIADDPPPPTKESDMWGFACICYEMLTGETPFMRHYRPLQLVTAFVKGYRITPLRPKQDNGPISVDGEPWVELAEGCWNYDSNKRPSAAEALKFLIELNVQDDRPSMDEELATLEAVKGSRVKVKIDYSRVLSIVRNN